MGFVDDVISNILRGNTPACRCAKCEEELYIQDHAFKVDDEILCPDCFDLFVCNAEHDITDKDIDLPANID